MLINDEAFASTPKLFRSSATDTYSESSAVVVLKINSNVGVNEYDIGPKGRIKVRLRTSRRGEH